MLDKNSSSGAAVSAPDHFGMSEINDRSLWIGGISIDKRSLNRAISALLSSNSMRNLSEIMEVCLSSQNFDFGILFHVMYGACQSSEVPWVL